MYGLRIKSPRGKGGRVTHVTYRDTHMENVGVPLIISAYYQSAPEDANELNKALTAGGFVVGDQIYPAESDPVQVMTPHKTPHFSDIRITNLTATGQSLSAGYILGVPEAPLHGLMLENVHIEAETGLLVRHARLDAVKLQLRVTSGLPLVVQKGGHVSSP